MNARIDFPDGFMARVLQQEDGCWIWQGAINTSGYGSAGPRLAHRASYEEFVGPIPAGLQIDHLCRVTLCVNPDHLEPVTELENKRRRYAIYTHCINGHEFTHANTYIRPSGHRDCRTCIRARVAAYKVRRAAAA